MKSKTPLDLSRMNRAVFEALDYDQLIELTCRLHTVAIEQAERLAMNSTNSSRPVILPAFDAAQADGLCRSLSLRATSKFLELHWRYVA